MKKSDRYLKIVEWSEQDHCYVGTCPGLMLGGVHGTDETKVYEELCQAVEEWIRIHEEDEAKGVCPIRRALRALRLPVGQQEQAGIQPQAVCF